jgi:hypothetical protein
MIEFGYKIKDGKVVIHDTNSQAVIAMHEWYLKSDSIYSVLAFLGASEYISPGGMKKWTRATVRKILGNPIYKGTDIFPRILPDQVIDQVNEAFERKNKRKSSEQKQSQLLIANVFCNECGSLMQPCGHHKDIMNVNVLQYPSILSRKHLQHYQVQSIKILASLNISS